MIDKDGTLRHRLERAVFAKRYSAQILVAAHTGENDVGAFGGRVLSEADDKPGSPPVAVLSHHVWQSAYGGDPSVIGATFVIEGHPFTAIGVAPPGFFGETLRGNPPDLWIPLHQEPLLAGARLQLARAVRQVFVNALTLLRISAPERI